MTASQQSMVQIKRVAHVVGFLVPYGVYLDDVKVGSVSNGAETWFRVTPGTHTLRLKQLYYLCDSVTFDIHPGETISFECRPKTLAMFYPYVHLERSDETVKTQAASRPQVGNHDIAVTLFSDYARVFAAREEVMVPRGVVIKVKRSRTIEHSIELAQQSTQGARLEAGILQWINASIHGEVQRSKQQGFRQSETIEYEIELNGSASQRYELLWIDVWQQGMATIRLATSGQQQVLPFQIRERAELQVRPLA